MERSGKLPAAGSHDAWPARAQRARQSGVTPSKAETGPRPLVGRQDVSQEHGGERDENLRQTTGESVVLDLGRVHVKSPKPRFGVSRPNADVVRTEAVKLALERTHYLTITAL
ncbi:hypothetical protein Bbelb_399150 [Branchiostoma belcheri]|nr:hypothetical protein Bbelb_399150 [Branchiostoma belcheri]